ncbi:hypothetical protein BH23VER1_BH23VER1_05100 [soil metagenome]
MLHPVPHRLALASWIAAVSLQFGTVHSQDANPPVAQKSLDDLRIELRTARKAEVPGLIDQIAAQDLSMALELAHDVEGGSGIIAGRWRPEADQIAPAFSTAASAGTSEYRNHLLLGLITQWTPVDPQAARAALQQLPEGSLRGDVQDQFVNTLIKTRPADALQMAVAEAGQPGVGIKVATAASALAHSDIDAAASAVAKIPADKPQARLDAISATTKRWADTDPKAATVWSAALPESDEQTVAYEEIAYGWGKSDPKAAGQWAASLEAGAPRDSALQAVVFQAALAEPASAFELAAKITAPELRRSCLESTLHTWATDNPDAARKALAESPLPDDEKAALAETIAES